MPSGPPQYGYRSRSLNPPSPFVNIESALAWLAFSAATAFSSIAFASAAVPKSAASASVANPRETTTSERVRNRRVMGILLYDVGVDPSRTRPGSSATRGLIRKPLPRRGELGRHHDAAMEPRVHLQFGGQE